MWDVKPYDTIPYMSSFFFFLYACHEHNYSAITQRLHPQSVAEISRYLVLSGHRFDNHIKKLSSSFKAADGYVS